MKRLSLFSLLVLGACAGSPTAPSATRVAVTATVAPASPSVAPTAPVDPVPPPPALPPVVAVPLPPEPPMAPPMVPSQPPSEVCLAYHATVQQQWWSGVPLFPQRPDGFDVSWCPSHLVLAGTTFELLIGHSGDQPGVIAATSSFGTINADSVDGRAWSFTFDGPAGHVLGVLARR